MKVGGGGSDEGLVVCASTQDPGCPLGGELVPRCLLSLAFLEALRPRLWASVTTWGPGSVSALQNPFPCLSEGS